MNPEVSNVDGRPLVSVIVPLFQGAATISETVSSLLAQSVRSWEAIVIDDGSTDRSAEAARRAARGDPRIRVIQQANAGLAAARNKGLSLAQGEYIHFLDADDRLLPRGLEILTRGAAQTGAAYGGARWMDESGRDLGWSFSPSCPRVGFDELLECGRWVPAGQLISRKLLGDLQFDASMPGLEDLDLWLRLGARGVKWCSVGRDVCDYRLRSNAMSRRWGMMARSHAGAGGRAFASPRPDHFVSIDRRVRLLAQIAMDYATAASTDPSSGLDRGLAIMNELAPGTTITPAMAAQAAAWMLPFAACLPPAAWEDRSTKTASHWCQVLDRWWTLMVRCGRVETGFVEKARRELARRIVSPIRIAERMVELIPANQTGVLLGLGRNGSVVAAALNRAGRPVVGFEDALGGDGGAIELGGTTVKLLNAVEAFHGDNVHLLTPGRDETLLMRVPRGASRIRWNAIADEMAASVHAQLMAIWPVAASDRLEAAA